MTVGSVKSTATCAVFKPWLRSSVSGTPIEAAADELAGIAAEQSVTGLRDGADEHEIVGLEDAAQHGRGPSGPRRRERLPSTTGYAPIRSKNSLTPSNQDRARGLCRPPSF